MIKSNETGTTTLVRRSIVQDRNDKKEALVDTQWLNERLSDPSIKIIDARPTAFYFAEHIKNSINSSYGLADYMSHGIDISRGGGVELFSDPSKTLPYQDLPARYLIEVFGKKLGIKRDDHIIIYTDGADSLASRLFYTLDAIGHKKVSILDGGLEQWQADGYETTNEIVQVEPVDYGLAEINENLNVDTAWMLAHMADPQVKLIAGLNYSRFYGPDVPQPREGHIPGTVCIPFSYHFKSDGTWKSSDEIRKMYADFGVMPEHTVVTYCNHNMHAAVNYFALRCIAGFPDVRMYMESAVGWCMDPRHLPLVTYGDYQIIKEPKWVFYWGVQAPPIMNDTKIRIVDVRPAEDYAAGHIPFSFNLPIEDFLAGEGAIQAVDKIEEILGANGISREHNVVVYDESDCHDAAVLFWILEYLGQKEVSVLNGGFAAWKNSKYAVNSDPGIICESKSDWTFDISTRPATYKSELCEEKVALQDWVNQYSTDQDKTFLVSGEDEEALGSVHIIWRKNLVENKLDSAINLFNLYNKAGVNPMEQIVCCSESIKDATHAYLALRLLGYPRVRVCLAD
jgi:thiosulfate/3-mercaptopyruvate sulfurtransferase